MRGVPKRRATVHLAIGLIAGSLCLLASCSRYGVRSIEDMKAGDCYNETHNFNKGDVVPCDTPHDAEIVAANAKGVSIEGSNILVGAGGKARRADCLGVPAEEADKVAAERGLKFSYFVNFDAYIVKSASGKLTEAVCRRK